MPQGTGRPGQVVVPAGAPRHASVSLRLNNGKRFELKGKAAYLIGRHDEASGIHPDLDLTPYGAFEQGVSRAHAMIHVRPDGCFIEDLGSTNETLWNFHRLLPRQLYALKDGDQLRFGALAALVIVE
jgi:pSer/pThr/pTyr-binding forkhead associated (FHA) protein